MLRQVGYITEDDVKTLEREEKAMVDQIIDNGPCPAGQLHYGHLLSLYLKVNFPPIDSG